MSVLVPIQHSHKDFIERNLAKKESDIQIRKKLNYLCSLSYTENVNKDEPGLVAYTSQASTGQMVAGNQKFKVFRGWERWLGW